MPSGPASLPTAAPLSNAPPYLPYTQALGEVPSVLPDVPVNAVFLVLFVLVGAGHAAVCQLNQRRGRKFLISLMVAGFCLTRVVSTALRIAWSYHPHDVNVAITTSVFVYAGTPLLFLSNFFFAQRVLRAQHPRFGWSRWLSWLSIALIVTTIATVICLIVAIIVRSYTLNPSTFDAVLTIQRYGTTWLAFFAFLPVIMVASSALARRHPYIRMTKTTDKFGEGSMRAKIIIVLVSGILLCLGASYRAAGVLMPPVPILLALRPPTPAPEPAYLSKACFYIFNFTIDIAVCLLWFFVRVDLRFHIPDGANGAFSYAGGFVFAGEAGNEKPRLSIVPGSQQSLKSAPSSVHSRDSRWTGRASVSSQRSRREKMDALEGRISWGGVDPDAVQHVLAEDGRRQIPYPAVVEGCTLEDLAVDVEDGAALREMGYDPKTGKWAIRPIVNTGGSVSRPVSMLSTRPPSMTSDISELP